MNSKLWDNLLDLLFPPRPGCPFCGSPGSETIVCGACRALLHEYRQTPRCRICGRLPEKAASGATGSIYLCSECRRHEWPFVLACAPGPYEGILKETVHRFKYNGLRRLAVPLATLMVELLLAEEFFLNNRIDLLLPVPLAANKLRRRGFNQAALLAKEIGGRFKIPVNEGVLVKIVDTPPQAGLTRSARENNLKSAFKVKGGLILQNKNVLLTDDVFTTGNTVSSIANLVRQAGAKQVFVITAATGRCS